MRTSPPPELPTTSRASPTYETLIVTGGEKKLVWPVEIRTSWALNRYVPGLVGLNFANRMWCGTSDMKEWKVVPLRSLTWMLYLKSVPGSAIAQITLNVSPTTPDFGFVFMVTCTVPIMPVWIEQWYEKEPATPKANVK